MTTYLVDNSVWRQAGSSAAIARRLREISIHDLLITCPPQVIEYCRSARTPEEYRALRDDMDDLLPAWQRPALAQALDIQQALWESDLPRTASALDCLIAAYAVENDAVILNCDPDFADIASATQGAVRQEFIAA